ncbi:TolC family outer membrane protein [Massilia timonae]|uniref:TolC family type I secretion outer membrane protein n=1 Tax=Massilia timonae CCUG 45783 TaxID=883126 RepID=K9DER5_9BURK|nr:TolC family outer membrane protein [Massilia timonae]EKU83219.1 TolC family type I secretion outer membrane protein [Massilia timonae CCUG 45783]
MARIHAFRLRTLAAGALLAAGFCGSAGAISLEEAYQAALKNDPTFRMREFEAESGKENRILGRAQLLPQVSASYSYNQNVTDRETFQGVNRPPSIDHPKYDSRSAVVQLRQPLFNMDAIQRYRQGKVQSAQAEQAYEAGVDEVSVRVVSAYMDALFAEDQLALARVQRDMYAEQQKVNDFLFQKGEGTKTDSLETRARLDLAEAQLVEAQDNVVAVRNTLAGVIGMDPGTLDQLGPNFRPVTLDVASFEEWRKLALERNNTLAATRLGVENARLDINRNRAGHLPRVDFVAAYSKSDSETLNLLGTESTNRSLGVQVNIPIYSGGAINAQTRQAAATYGRAQAELDARTNETLIELRRAHDLVMSSGRKIDALAKAVESSKELMRATEQSIKGGVRINLDLLTAQQTLFTSQRDLAQARYSYLVGLMRLRAASGTMAPDAVREIGAFFR